MIPANEPVIFHINDPDFQKDLKKLLREIQGYLNWLKEGENPFEVYSCINAKLHEFDSQFYNPTTVEVEHT